jgi:CheY-like chemotaxis protein
MLRLRGSHVLVLEDEPIIALLLEAELREEGATVAIANNCSEALRIAKTTRIDCASLDLHIGQSDCREVAEYLHESGIPFIATSGDAYAYDFGATARVMKPFTREQLISALLVLVPSTRLTAREQLG